MRAKLTSFLMILCLLMFFAAVAGAAPAGKVTNLEGRADLTAPGKPAKALFIGDAVNVGDILRTKSGSKLEVTWVDGSIARLSENSRLKVTEFSLGAQKRSTILSLFRGKVQSIVTGTTKLFGTKDGSRYEVHTPTSVCGVRGTKFYVYYENGVSGALFTEGRGSMYSKGQPGVVKPIAPGVLMIVTSANKPPVSKPATPGDANKLFNATNPSEKKKDDKKGEDDKGQGGGGASGAGGGTFGSGSGGTTGEPMLGGDPPPPPLPPLTPPPPPPIQVVVPVVEPEPTPPTDTFTTLEQPVILGDLSGTLTGSISDTTNTGTIDLTGTGTSTIYVSPITGGTLSDDSTYDAYLAGIPGSWRGLFTGLSNKSSVLSFLKGDLDGTYIPPNGADGSVTASGSLVREATGYTSTGSFGLLGDVYLPVINSIYTGSSIYTSPESNAVSGYLTSTGGQVGIWGITTNGGYSNFDGLQTWTTQMGSFNGYYAFLGSVQVTDDLQGHLSISGENLTYMDQSYLGSFGLQYRATYSGTSYEAIGTGTYNLAPLKYSGYWGAMGTLYTNVNGSMTTYGWDSALIGGLTQAPWTGITDFKAIGSYTASGGAAYALWNTQLGGSDTASRAGYFQGTTAGIWGSAIPGSIRAIYVTPSDYDANTGTYTATAGILTSDDIAITPYEVPYGGPGMWQASGTLGPYSNLTYSGDSSTWEIMPSYYTEEVDLMGSFGASAYPSIYGYGYFTTQYLTYTNEDDYTVSPPWGTYNLKMGGNPYDDAPIPSIYSGKPAASPVAWNTKIGGEGDFGFDDGGYFLATVSGDWDEDAEDAGHGTISGNLDGTYLTATHKGTIRGPFYGLYTQDGIAEDGGYGTWIGSSVGVYEGEKLAFSGMTIGALWQYGPHPYTPEESPAPMPITTMAIGLLGGTDETLFDQSQSLHTLTLMGAYGTDFEQAAVAAPQLMLSLVMGQTGLQTETPDDDGVFVGFMNGIWANGVIEKGRSRILAFYVDPTASEGELSQAGAGYLYGALAQNGAYVGAATEGVWTADVNVTAKQNGTTTTESMELPFSFFTGHVSGDGIRSAPIAPDAPELIGASLGLSDQNWGIWTVGTGGTYDGTDLPETILNAGGTIGYDPAFVDAPIEVNPDQATGYWVGNVSLAKDVDAYRLKATASGHFLTTQVKGDFSTEDYGGISGTYTAPVMGGTTVVSPGTWQATGLGVYENVVPLAFSAGIDWGNSGYVSGGQMFYDEEDGASFRGTIGSTDPFIGDSAPPNGAALYGIGTYYAAGAHPLLEMDISRNVSSATPNTDSLSIWFGGIKSSTQFAGKMMGLYANWNGTNYDVGFLTSGSALDSPVTGNLYSSIGMWEITGGSLKSEAPDNIEYRTLTTADNITPDITMTDTARTGSIAGTQGISGTSNSYDMYFTSTNRNWGVWRSENGGTYTGEPAANWTGVAGNKDNVNYDYAISHLTGADWADGIITGTASGRFLDMTSWGRSSGDIMGTYSSGNWQTISLGKQEKTENLSFASELTGNLYQVVPGTVYNKEYQRPYGETSPYNSYFDPLRYETVYFKYGNPETYSPTTTIGFEWAEREGTGDTYKDEYHYYPSGKWVKITKGQGITRAAGSGITSDSLDLSDPSTSPNFMGTVISDPATPFVSYNNYVASFSTAWNTNALIQNGAFTGILGGLNNYPLWSSDTDHKTNLILMGSHDAYNGSQIFGTSMSYDGSGTNNGAFYGALAGIIQDTDPAAAYRENPLTGLAIGLYIDPSGNAGVLKGNFTGKSYTGINMWESDDTAGAATVYRYSAGMASGLDPTTLADNIFTGAIGPGINSGVYGTFGGSGLIRSPFGLMGRTYSIASQPNWGIFIMQVGLANTYENPSAATGWTSTLFGSGIFGKYDASYGTYADLGYWYTDLTSGTWAGGKMTGTMNGEFLTLLKKGTIEGSLLGTYDGTTSGAWQATAAGTYEKTQEVSFSSEIWGDSHALVSGKTGQVEGDGYGYRFYYNPEGDNRYGSSEYGYYDSSAQTNKKVIRRFDIQGPPEAELPHRNTWVQDTKNTQDPSDDTYTFETFVYQNDDGSPDYAAYYADMALLEKNPKTGGSVTAYDSMQFHNYNFNGIMAGVDNLWTNIASNAATNIYLMGDIETESATPKLFTGTVVSFNPRVNPDPYNNSTAPIGGAYFAYLGGAFGKETVDYDKIDGMLSGLYRNIDGSVGVLYGTFDGDNDMNVGFWNASGSMKGYKLLAGTTASVTAANFASLLITSSSQHHWIGNYLSADGALGGNTNITMAYLESTTTALSVSYYPTYWQTSIGGGFGTVKLLAGGTYVDPLSSYKVDFAFDTYNNQGWQSTIYSSTVWDTTITNNVYNGSVLHNGSFDAAKATGLVSVTVDHQQGGTLITGADIKGLFDPVAHTWQAVANGTAIETTAFVNLVNSFTTDAERNAFMAAMKIPCINVGSVDLAGARGTAGSGNYMSVNMPHVGFYSYSTGQAPRIFATTPDPTKGGAGVWGSYEVGALGGAVPAAVSLTASNMTNFTAAAATFTPTTWNTSANTWGAQVTGSAAMTTPDTGILFKGGAAGSLVPNQATPGTGVFGGSAAGVVRTGTLPQ